MFFARVCAIACLSAGLTFAADPSAVKQAADVVAQKIELAPASQRAGFRSLAAATLRPQFPALADKFAPESKRAPAGTRPAGAPRPTPPAEIVSIQAKMRQLRGLPTDEDRAGLVLQIIADIRALPPAIPKLDPTSMLSHLVTEGDLGKEALHAVASTLAQALNQTAGSASDYVDLARLIRYEHLTTPAPDPSLDAATALLELHDRIVQFTGFELTALDGRTYGLESLRGKIVLLNFWATWCPPCRREMPDMEKLYQRFSSKGLVVLAVSDEKRQTVEDFLKKQNYTFPVLLDDGRTLNTAFGIEGIPNSFLFNREGKLVGEAIDMRTERQFLEMFKAAGLK
jgi:peroxiredoxin